MPRAFTAIDIPSRITQRLSTVQEELEVGRPIKSEKMHITLEFFENLETSQLNKLQKHLNQIETKPFNVEVKNLGVFPSESYIRVIWAGINSKHINELYRKASRHELEADNDHEFRPHVTLARVDDVRRGDKKRIHEKLRKYSGHSFGSFEAEKLKLYKSELGPKTSNYSELYTREL